MAQLNYKHLRYFWAVARSGSIARASEQLGRELAQAIAADPSLIVLDEPTDGLDPNQKNEVRSLIKSMSAQKAVILSTHILEEVEAVCTRAVIINRGTIVFDGTPQSFKERGHGQMEQAFYNLTGAKAV